MQKLLPPPAVNFTILPPAYIEPKDLMVIVLAYSVNPYSEKQILGRFVGSIWQDEAFRKKINRMYGLLNLRGIPYQVHTGRLETKPANVRSAETNIKTQITKITNEYNRRRLAIEQGTSLFKTDELAKLQQEYEQACKTLNDRATNPEYLELIKTRQNMAR